jgi:hypothetical protein
VQLPLGQQGVFPVFGQLARDQAVFRFDQAIMAGGPFGLIGDALQAVVPQLIQSAPLLLHVRGRFQREGQRRRGEGSKDPLTDKGIDGLTWEILTIVPALVGG